VYFKEINPAHSYSCELMRYSALEHNGLKQNTTLLGMWYFV